LTRIGEEIGAVIEYNFSIESEFDAFYFLYGLLVPRWHHALGQLLNFLAYDLVLIVPFLWLFKTAKPEYVFSLIVYVAVLIYSGAIAVYFLFVNSQTRIRL